MSTQGRDAACGHDSAQFVTSDEGTSYCPACEAEARSAAMSSEKCGAVSIVFRHVCGRDKGHGGPHVAVYANHTVGWGGTISVKR